MGHVESTIGLDDDVLIVTILYRGDLDCGIEHGWSIQRVLKKENGPYGISNDFYEKESSVQSVLFVKENCSMVIRLYQFNCTTVTLNLST